jgi:hypothetical protein
VRCCFDPRRIGCRRKARAKCQREAPPEYCSGATSVEPAYDKVVAAQRANEFDLGGHAKKAGELLEEAIRELQLAAEAANQR